MIILCIGGALIRGGAFECMMPAKKGEDGNFGAQSYQLFRVTNDGKTILTEIHGWQQSVPFYGSQST